ncbi:MAG: Cadmium, zinc and cobalt-transporting ATPase [Firmicutes bacterium ADurb.Bin182]|nr:MAG: Cadmium, zinc and cobalt-transporting ATPase [Firmicutes bacterium ADurb.Bin182]
MDKKQKYTMIRLIAGAVLFISAYLIPAAGWLRLLMFLVPYAVMGGDILYNAVRNVFKGQLLDENFLMSAATVGAFYIGEYPEAVAVMLFYQIGELFQSYAVGKSRRSIADLMDIRPDYANIEKDGKLIKTDPEQILIGDVIVVKPGEKIPLDGTVQEGAASIDTSALTGESLPRKVSSGDEVISGCVNMNGLIKVVVNRTFGESTVTKILDLVENSAANKAKPEYFITKFSRWYTPAAVAGALLLAVIPPLLFRGSPGEWIRRALIFLVISCPCALVISIPLTFFGGIGSASKRGILVKGANYLEALSDSEIVVFDKTGTLTKGVFYVTAVHPEKISEAMLLELAATAESYSDHPISVSLAAAYKKDIDRTRVSETEEIPGHGIRAVIDGKTVHVGSSRLMDIIGSKWNPCSHQGSIVHVAVDGEYAGHIVISDEIKDDSAQTIKELKKLRILKTVMLTGDRKAVGKDVAKTLDIDENYCELLPQDKVKHIEMLMAKKSGKGKLVFVGDGINDAPVLARADIGIAMGALGSGSAIEAADIVLMDDKPSKIPVAIKISRRTKKIAVQNIVLALGVKFIALLLGALGIANLWEAVFADVGVSVLAVLNSTRALKQTE